MTRIFLKAPVMLLTGLQLGDSGNKSWMTTQLTGVRSFCSFRWASALAFMDDADKSVCCHLAGEFIANKIANTFLKVQLLESHIMNLFSKIIEWHGIVDLEPWFVMLCKNRSLPADVVTCPRNKLLFKDASENHALWLQDCLSDWAALHAFYKSENNKRLLSTYNIIFAVQNKRCFFVISFEDIFWILPGPCCVTITWRHFRPSGDEIRHLTEHPAVKAASTASSSDGRRWMGKKKSDMS